MVQRHAAIQPVLFRDPQPPPRRGSTTHQAAPVGDDRRLRQTRRAGREDVEGVLAQGAVGGARRIVLGLTLAEAQEVGGPVRCRRLLVGDEEVVVALFEVQLRLHPRDRIAEFGVEDALFRLRDGEAMAELAASEVGVDKRCDDAELVGGDHDCQHVDAVLRHHAHRVAGLEAGGAQNAGKSVGAGVELGPGHRLVLEDEGGALAEQGCIAFGEFAKRTPLLRGPGRHGLLQLQQRRQLHNCRDHVANAHGRCHRIWSNAAKIGRLGSEEKGCCTVVAKRTRPSLDLPRLGLGRTPQELCPGRRGCAGGEWL